MKFTNAYIGVKRISIAELLTMIVGIIAFAILIMTVIGNASSEIEEMTLSSGSNLAILISAVVALILLIVSFILTVTGIIKASKDDTAFRTSLIFLIISFVTAIVSVIFKSNVAVSQITETVSRVAQLGVTVYIIQGIMDIAQKIENEKMVRKGKNMLVFLLIIYTLIVLADILAMLFQTNTVTLVIAVVFDIVAYTLYLIQFILFFVYLFKANKMLKPYSD